MNEQPDQHRKVKQGSRVTTNERAKGIRKVATPSEGKSVKCRANKSTGDESKANRGIAPKPRYEMMVHFVGRRVGEGEIAPRERMDVNPSALTARHHFQFFLIPSFKTSLTSRQHARSAIRVSPNVRLVIRLRPRYSIGRVCSRCIIKTNRALVATRHGKSDDCILLNGI